MELRSLQKFFQTLYFAGFSVFSYTPCNHRSYRWMLQLAIHQRRRSTSHRQLIDLGQ